MTNTKETPGINPDLFNLIIKLQEINKEGLEHPERDKRLIGIGERIRREKLIEKSGDKDFAKQLLFKNNVPSKYWE